MEKKFKGTYFISSIAFTSSIIEFGISSIFTLFLLYVLHFSFPLVSKTFANYYGFTYFLPIIIGYLSDKFLSKTDTLAIGFISTILSQFILAYAASLYQPSNIIYDNYVFTFQSIIFFIGLFFLALGTGLTTLSITHMIFSINDKNSTMHAFSIYYPILNIGVMVGPILMSVFVGTNNYNMYSLIFLLFGFISIVGLIVFFLLKNKYLVDNEDNLMEDKRPLNNITPNFNNLLSKISSKSIFEIKQMSLRKKLVLFNNSMSIIERDRITAFLLFLLIIIFYRVAYAQFNIGMVFFLDLSVDRKFLSFELPVQLFFILNPIFILLLSPLFIKFNNVLDKRNIEFGFINRTITAFFIMTFCFLMLSVLGYFLDMNALPLDKISFIWILIFEMFVALSELFFSISGYSLVGLLAPEKYYQLFFGLFTATRAAGMYFSGLLSILFPAERKMLSDLSFSFNIPTNGLMAYFLIFVILNLISVTILIVYKDNIKRKMHLDEIK